ncbi:MAG: hypothetical protein IE885_05730 [Campylobacterales bacterium]|nr:hypothetical protein [Campylobacterales bacterium]
MSEKENQSIFMKKEFNGIKMVMSDAIPKTLAAYYVANPQNIDILKIKLQANGFEILSTEEILKDKTVVTVTNAELKQSNSFIAALHILVDGTKEIRVQNPSYFGAAFLQEKYRYGQFKGTLMALHASLGDMYETEDKMNLNELSGYHFMLGMPHVDNTIDVARGKDLFEKIKSNKASKYISYTLSLPNGSILVGHRLSEETNKFLTSIHVENKALILPYGSIIKENKAYILAPKYYLALSLPLLQMTDFMKIATTPDAIQQDIERAYE